MHRMGNPVFFCSLQAFQQPPPGETPASLPHDLCPRPGQGAASHRHVRRVHQDVQRVDPRVELHLVEAQKRVKRKLSEKELFFSFRRNLSSSSNHDQLGCQIRARVGPRPSHSRPTRELVQQRRRRRRRPFSTPLTLPHQVIFWRHEKSPSKESPTV